MDSVRSDIVCSGLWFEMPFAVAGDPVLEVRTTSMNPADSSIILILERSTSRTIARAHPAIALRACE
jgi:hypothetical protein